MVHGSFSGTLFTAIGHGNKLELDDETGLADGQQVSVVISAIQDKSKPQRGQLYGFGGWADDPESVERFVEEKRRLRDMPSERATGLSVSLSTLIFARHISRGIVE